MFLLALIVRLFALAANPDILSAGLIKDSRRFEIIAENLLEHGSLRDDAGNYANITPVYPLIIAGFKAIPGVSGRVLLILFQIILGAAAAWYVYRLGSGIFGTTAGWIAGVLYAVYWPLARFQLQVMAETVYTPLLIAGVYYLYRSVSEKKVSNVVIAAMIMAAATLTRPAGYYLPLFLVIFAAGLTIIRKYRLNFSLAAFFLAVYFVGLVPWGLRNYQVLGKFITSSTISGMVLATGNMPREGRIFGFDLRKHYLPAEKQHILDLPELEKNRELKKLALEVLADNPGKIPRLLLLKTAYFLSPFDWEILGKGDGTFNPWFFWVGIFSLVGIVSTGFRKPAAVLILAVIGYFLLLSLVTYGSPRLRLPVIPLFLIFAAQGWIAAFGKGIEKKLSFDKKQLLALVAILVLSVISVCYDKTVIDVSRSVLLSTGLW